MTDLFDGARTLGLELDERQAARLLAHLDLVDEWGQFDTVIARAVGPLADLVRNAGALVAAGGRLLAMKGRYPTDEMARKLNGWKVIGVHPLRVPGLEEERHLVELAHSHEKV
ncbi:MAG: rRNA (guanine527-N7)-methyltransferase [Steroidobacteraceae bacterium]|nr:rRNA (guanine527-N7)-methyltransferase [Steroidobacteraceae bacterium]